MKLGVRTSRAIVELRTRAKLTFSLWIFTTLALIFWGRIALGSEVESAPLIQVRSVVEIDDASADIQLSDLVIARGFDSRELQKMFAIRLADAPKKGEARVFTSAGLRPLIQEQVRQIEVKFGVSPRLKIPPRVTVTRKNAYLKEVEVEKELRRQWQEVCADCRFEIGKLTMPIVPGGISSDVLWSIRMRPDLPRGSFSAKLEIQNASAGSSQSYWVSGAVAVRREVPVATRAIGFGEKIVPDDYSMEWKDVTYTTDSPSSETQLATSVAARSIGAGQILWSGHLRREVAVRPGEVVKVSAGSEEWQISIDGISQSQGYVGDLVRVKIPRTQKIISGLLKEKGLVEVR